MVLTVKYRPSVTVNTARVKTNVTPANTLIPSSNTTDSDASFNAGGFGFDFEFSDFSATMKSACAKTQS